MTNKAKEIAAMCCCTLCNPRELIAEIEEMQNELDKKDQEIEALRLQVAMLKRNLAKIDKIDRFGRVEPLDVDWSKRPDIIGPNGNDGEHYNDI